jgi:hypothetical protein
VDRRAVAAFLTDVRAALWRSFRAPLSTHTSPAMPERATRTMRKRRSPSCGANSLSCFWETPRATNGLNARHSCCSGYDAVDGFEIHDGGCAADVEEVFPNTDVASAPPLLMAQVCEPMLDGNSFAEAFTALGSSDEFA